MAAAAAPRPLLLDPLVPRGARVPRVLRPPSPRGEGAPGGRPGPRLPITINVRNLVTTFTYKSQNR